MRYELDSNRFLIGNNCTVGFLYKNILQKPYETPFTWNYCTYSGLIWLSRHWSDIDWERQDFTPTLMSTEEIRRRGGTTLAIPSCKTWHAMVIASKGNGEFLACLPHFQEWGQTNEQIYRRRERMLNAIKAGRKPLFVLAKSNTEPPYATHELDAMAADDNIVLCDFSEGVIQPDQIAREIALPNLIERGYVKAVEE